MAPLKAGDKFPSGVKFEWAPITDDDPTSCGRPQEYDADKEFAGKKVVLISVPGAFTPSCQAYHLPPYIQKYDELKSKDVDIVAVIASNDCWVMCAWGKINNVKDDRILFLADTKTKFSENYGWAAGMGDRNGRWAMIIEKDGTVSYAENESDPRQVTVSGADAVLSKFSEIQYGMETLNNTTWDVLISGTGIQQSLLALHYGGAEAAFSLQEAESWAQEVAQDEPKSSFRNAAIVQPSFPTGSNGPKLSFSRAYSLALAPQIIYTRSALLPVLLSSKVYRQLEFLAVGSWWLYTPDSSDAASEASGSTRDEDSKPASKGRLTRIPSGREDVFADQSLDIRSKRALMKFLRFVADYENQPELWEAARQAPFPEFLSTQFKLPAASHDMLLALTLSPAAPLQTTTEYALPRIARHLRSIGLFGPGFGAVIPKWGGLAEIAQVSCRAGAVGGGTYVLGKRVMEIEVKSESADDAGTIDTSPPQAFNTTLVGEDGTDVVSTACIVGSDEDLSSSSAPSQDAQQSARRSISIVSSHLEPLFPPLAEGAPAPAGAVVVFPAGSLSDSGVESATDPPVHVLAHTSDTGECPDGQSVLYASTTAPGTAGFALLDRAVSELLHCVGKEQPPPTVLWSLRYEQSQSAPTSPASASTNEGKILRFPQSSLDLAFDDGMLERVRKVWQEIVGPDAGSL
ncbi:Rab proteins geranylgeranyltransferase component A [Coniosporium tulheliwenetii]|uniref:Rab proteins geranylgeranyltransferase component A n=1 Tax=Coniosporium tulheliwenetii TaxID=3383036 RepID=A0ACC2YJT3_9PEZI|nr:Rab proteins geranylgeranyltransferase component A [Cladosporium sp. JES 115]